ncbi:MAG: YceI family protein [Myxococcales bacterium]|nr:YceI family protein [Myxococcales bacterium]
MSGQKPLGPEQGSVRVLTFKEGLLSPLGHDLVIVASKWKGEVTIEDREPPVGTVAIEIEADSLTVEGPDDLSAKDRDEIQENIRGKVLETKKFPTVRFRSTRVASAGKGKIRVEGTLNLHGVERPLSFESALESADGAIRVQGETPLTQTDFKIKPYKAPLGVIKVKDVVRIRWDLRISTPK